MGIIIVKDKIALKELKLMADSGFGEFVKAVIDIENAYLAIDAELHSDEEAILLDDGSHQANLWGINIYPYELGINRIEFDSLINIRPRQNNRSRNVEDKEIQKKITELVNKMIIE